MRIHDLIRIIGAPAGVECEDVESHAGGHRNRLLDDGCIVTFEQPVPGVVKPRRVRVGEPPVLLEQCDPARGAGERLPGLDGPFEGKNIRVISDPRSYRYRGRLKKQVGYADRLIPRVGNRHPLPDHRIVVVDCIERNDLDGEALRVEPDGQEFC